MPEYIDAIVVMGLFLLICYIVVSDLRDTNDVPHPKLPQVPKLPELVCTCGDCWELPLDQWKLIECGCDTCYTVLAERKREP